MILVASRRVREKLEEEHQVSFLEVEEAYQAHMGPFLLDDRAGNRTVPPTVWFISETFDGRILRVVVRLDRERGRVILRTAYEPSEEEMALYEANE